MVICEYHGLDMQIGYIQNNASKTEQIRQHQALLSYAKDKGICLECVYVDVSFANIQETILPSCNEILVYNISSLGESLAEIKDNLVFCKQHNLSVQAIEDGYDFKVQNLTDDFFKGIEVAIEVRSRLISKNTKKVLQQKKEEGMKLGRPFGAIVKKRLEGKEEEIRQLLLQKVTKAEIARRFGVSRITVFNFVKRNGLENKENSFVEK